MKSLRPLPVLLFALLLAGCGNKGPLTLSARPAAEPEPVIELDVPPPRYQQSEPLQQGEQADDADAPLPRQEGDEPPAQDDDPR